MHVSLVLLMTAALAAAQEIPLKADRVAHVLIVKEVYLNGQGPFRMMVDTGAASCIARPSVAKRLGLRTAYSVEHVTVTGVKPVPVVVLDEMRIGSARDQGVELLVTDVAFPEVDGVVGQSWLVRHDYLLDYHNHRLVLNAAAPSQGVRTALHSNDGRPMLSAMVDGQRQELVLDSGASALVLFGRSGTTAIARVSTNNGSMEVGTGSAQLNIGDGYRRRMTAAIVNAPPQPGLLPAGSFASIYVSNRDGLVVLVP